MAGRIHCVMKDSDDPHFLVVERIVDPMLPGLDRPQAPRMPKGRAASRKFRQAADDPEQKIAIGDRPGHAPIFDAVAEYAGQILRRLLAENQAARDFTSSIACAQISSRVSLLSPLRSPSVMWRRVRRARRRRAAPRRTRRAAVRR